MKRLSLEVKRLPLKRKRISKRKKRDTNGKNSFRTGNFSPRPEIFSYKTGIKRTKKTLDSVALTHVPEAIFDPFHYIYFFVLYPFYSFHFRSVNNFLPVHWRNGPLLSSPRLNYYIYNLY